MDAGWIFFYLLWGAAALHPSMQDLSEVETDRQPKLTWLRLAMLAGASLTAPALELAKVIPTHNSDLMFVIGASVVLFSLVVGRMTGLIRQREKSVARERALSAAGGLLVAASEPRDIVIAALQAVADFGQASIEARICVISDADIRALSLDEQGALTNWMLSDETAALVRAQDADRVSVPTTRSCTRAPRSSACSATPTRRSPGPRSSGCSIRTSRAGSCAA